MTYNKPEKMHVLEMIRRGEEVPTDDKHNFIVFDLLEDEMIVHGEKNSSMHLTYFGFKELEDWDPVLQVTVNQQLLYKPYGDA